MDIERLINRHKDAVYRQMVRTCGNRDDAEDALAEALFAALKASDQLQRPEYFQAWLSKIGTRSCARMRIRERLVQFTSVADLEAHGFELSDGEIGPVQAAELSALKTCVAGAIELLPDMYREAYLRREIIDEKAEDVATALSISVQSRGRRQRLESRWI